VLQNGFINYDDPDYVTENPMVLGGLHWNAVGSAFSTPYASNWHPLTWLSHMLDCQLFGVNPAGHHFTNLLLHTANTLLLFFLLRGLTGALWRSAFVAAFFALHPLHVESVAWVAERKDVLSTLFFLLTLFAYARYAQQTGDRRWKMADGRRAPYLAASHLPASIFYFLSLIFFALGLMSKPMLVTLPFILLLLDYWPLGRVRAPIHLLSLLVEKAPFFALAIASCAVTVWAQHAGHAMVSLESIPLGMRLANAPSACLVYLQKTLWPAHLGVFYPHLGMPGVVELFLATALLVGVSLLVVWQLTARPVLAVGWLWFLGTLVPVLGLVQVGLQAYADRYTYIPSIGLFLFLIWGVASITHAVRVRRAFAALGAAGLGGCIVLSAAQVQHWKNGKTLFTHTREVTKCNYLACTFVAEAMTDEGKFDKAVELLDEAVSYSTNYAEAYLSYGRVLERTGHFEAATKFYSKALQLNPRSDLAQYGMASALAKLKQFPEGIEHYNEALRLNPNLWQARLSLGLALMGASRPAEAVIQLGPVVQAQPRNAEIRFILALALSASGQTNEARQSFEASLALDPALPDKDCAEGKSLAAKGELEGAASKFRAALLLKPDHVEAHEQLGLLLAQQGQIEAAVTHFNEVLRLRPDAQAYYNLALARVVQGNVREAITHYQQAVKLKPDWDAALNDLAWLLATHPSAEVRDGSEAVRLAERACQLGKNTEARYWGTLDAAYAESRRFADAIRTAEKTRQLALAAGQSEVAQAAEQRLGLYQKNQPYRQAEPTRPLTTGRQDH
jgi:tetratricopeptide (TPR) repeat protein